MASLQEQRTSAIHLLRAGHKVQAVAQQLGRSERWVRKWWQRYQQAGWAGLAVRSRAPHRVHNRLSDAQRQQIIIARSAVEAAAAEGTGLKFIGASAVRTQLKIQGCEPLPSLATIERVLRHAGMTKPRQQPTKEKVRYPRLQTAAPQQLCQIDIIPHYLSGGARVFCFNAIDVVSRYATGMAYASRRAQEACAFLQEVWQTMGIPQYTQLDNDSCFDGGHTHPYVLGRVVRFALWVGTEVVFSPVRHPESNGYVERFHQEYDRHVWRDTYLADLAEVRRAAARFFSCYNASGHHTALGGRTPQEVHGAPAYRLPADFSLPAGRLPLYEGRVHFMRQVLADHTVSVLNISWPVPSAKPQQGIWVTLELRPSRAELSIYDEAPDVPSRRCLVTHPFPVTEAILQRPPTPIGRPTTSSAQPASSLPSSPADTDRIQINAGVALALLFQTVFSAARCTYKAIFGTMC